MPSVFWSPDLIGWAKHSSCCSHSLLGNPVRGRFLREQWSWTCRGLWEEENYKITDSNRQRDRQFSESIWGRGKAYRERNFLLNIHLHSVIGHHAPQAIINSVLSPQWQVTMKFINITAVHMPHFFSSIQCCHIPENQLQIILTLTYAYRDICRPLIVVLAGDRFFSNQLKPKLAFKSQDSSIWKVVTFSYSIERSSRVSTTLFVYFWNDTDSKEDMNSNMVPKDGYKQSMLTGILT